MIKKKKKSHKKLWIILGSIFAFLGLIFISLTIYVNIYYSANAYAKEELQSDAVVNVFKENDYYIFEPQQYDTGIIFYPGGKVDAVAYAPLLKGLAKEGILCILCEMPFRLAVLNKDAADPVIKRYSVDDWYMAGHSLGGSMAAAYTYKHSKDISGLILLAAYSTYDLSDLNLNIISIYGENDGILNLEKYKSNCSLLSKDYKEYVLSGGNHAYFGAYGNQKKDGEATITNKQQIQSTVSIISNHLKKKEVITYKESIDSFSNPDCGFYTPIYLKCEPSGVSNIYENYLKYNALLHLRIDISMFSKQVNQTEDLEFTEKMLKELDQVFEKINNASCSVILRFAYDPGFNGKSNMEPAVSVMEKHIESLGFLFKKYEKMITAVECGMIGPWGEMHSSLLATQETYNTLIDAYLKALPNSIRLLVRRPKFAYNYYGYTLATLHTFSVSNCRLGVYNDGYLGSSTDLGTYDNRELEVQWLSKINQNTPYGGEVVVPDSSYNELNHAVSEMFDLKLSYLNSSWNDQVIKRWKNTIYKGEDVLYQNQTEYDYIFNHLGYRFVMENLVYSDKESYIDFTLNIKNVGFGSLCKEKNVYVIFQNEANTYVHTINVSNYTNMDFRIEKQDMALGSYKVYLVIADEFKEYGIRSIRFGNQDTWDDSVKGNILISEYIIKN